MARRSSTVEAEGTEPEVSTTEAVEAEAGTEPTEAPAAEASTEAADKAEPAIDLTAFEAAVTAAIEGKDSSTGEVAPALVAPVVSEFRALNGQKARNAAKNLLNEKMRDSMNNMDIATARSYMSLSDSLTTAPKGHVEKAPANPTEAFVNRQVAARLAVSVLNGDVPDGVDATWQDTVKAKLEELGPQVDQYRAFLADTAEDKTEPEVDALVKSAFKLAAGKAAGVRKAATGGSSYTGERRDIAKHIQSAFADKESGTFLTVAEIRNARSDEYGDNPPSAGAISARLFPASGKCTVEGIVPGTNASGNRGATKA